MKHKDAVNMSAAKKVIGIQFGHDDLKQIAEYAEAENASLAWVVRKCVKIALPQLSAKTKPHARG